MSEKVEFLLKAVAPAPILKQKKFILEGSKDVAYLCGLLRKMIALPPDQSLFIYVNECFAPSPDHTIQILKDCFAPGEHKLVLHYSTTHAWG